MRLAAYCRVSTDKAEQKLSLCNQQSFYREYAKENGRELVRIYSDEGLSGKQMKNRESFLRMIEDGEKGEFDLLAVKDVSRFARNTCDFLNGVRRLKARGIDVRFLSSNSSVFTDSEFILTIYAALAQQESENLSKRVIFGKTETARQGRVPGTIFGYDKSNNFTLTINKSEALTVCKVFTLYTSDNLSCSAIAQIFNENSVPTKLRGEWTQKSISRIIKNPIYIGRLINHKSTTADFLSGTRKALPESEWFVHERPELRIVSDDIFFLANDILKSRVSNRSR